MSKNYELKKRIEGDTEIVEVVMQPKQAEKPVKKLTKK
jgi:hypothetical protein